MDILYEYVVNGKRIVYADYSAEEKKLREEFEKQQLSSQNDVTPMQKD